MKTIFCSIAALLASLLFTATASAGLIQYQGYSRADNSNVVQGDGMEWLQWSSTKGLSIDSALQQYSAQGWRLASNTEMTMLFNRFQFGKSNWHAQETVQQKVDQPWTAHENSIHRDFLTLFGHSQFFPHNNNDPDAGAFALYGSDANQNGLYNLARVFEDWSAISQGVEHRGAHNAMLFEDLYRSNFSSGNVAVALVRGHASQVTAPGSAALMLLALTCLLLGRRR